MGVSPSSGLVFGKYEVIRRLAIGGMGEVFLARQVGIPGFERLVILKNLLPELAAQADSIDMFLDEARVAATLNHPNVVAIYEVGLWDGMYFIAMEYIHGVDLAKLIVGGIRANARVPVPVAVRIIRDAALGLHHAHTARDVNGRPLNIIHRDVSPQNIMVRGDGVTKVVDFGIAKASNRASRTQTGLVKGKLNYMPPEQILNEGVDPRADQFSLGVVLWECIAGRRLFKADNELQTMKALLDAPIPSLDTVVPECPVEVAEIVTRMLQRPRDQRFESCAEVASVMSNYLSALSREVGEPLVAETVQQLVGKDLDGRLENLTPASAKNFVLELRSSNPPTPAENPTGAKTLNVDTGQQLAAGGKRTPLLVGVAALALVAVGGGALWMRQSQKVAATAATPAPPPKPTMDVAVNGTSIVVKEPVGASLTLNGVATEKSVPATLEDLAPGVHTVTATLHGAAVTQQVEVLAAARPAPVTLESDPPRAAVWLGDQPMGTTPVTLPDLKPGVEYEFHIGLRGYANGVAVVKPVAGETTVARVVLQKVPDKGHTVKKDPPRNPAPPAEKPEPAAPPPPTLEPGTFSLRTTPWARLFIDGKPYGQTPVYRIPLAAGKHTVRLTNEGAKIDVTRTITLPSKGNFNETWTIP